MNQHTRRDGCIVEISGTIETVKAGHERCRECGKRLRPEYVTTAADREHENRVCEERPSGAGWREVSHIYSPQEFGRIMDLSDAEVQEITRSPSINFWTRTTHPIASRRWTGRWQGERGVFCTLRCGASFGARCVEHNAVVWTKKFVAGREQERKALEDAEKNIRFIT